jgi:hypothetical protein
MKTVSFILNLPRTLISIIFAILSVPTKLSINKKPFALIFYVKSFWWYEWLSGKKGVRGMAQGNAVLLGPNALTNDLEHELIPVEQFERYFLIQPILYILESIRHGYLNNRFEREAYEKAGNRYITAEERAAIEKAKRYLRTN